MPSDGGDLNSEQLGDMHHLFQELNRHVAHTVYL